MHLSLEIGSVRPCRFFKHCQHRHIGTRFAEALRIHPGLDVVEYVNESGGRGALPWEIQDSQQLKPSQPWSGEHAFHRHLVELLRGGRRGAVKLRATFQQMLFLRHSRKGFQVSRRQHPGVFDDLTREIGKGHKLPHLVRDERDGAIAERRCEIDRCRSNAHANATVRGCTGVDEVIADVWPEILHMVVDPNQVCLASGHIKPSRVHLFVMGQHIRKVLPSGRSILHLVSKGKHHQAWTVRIFPQIAFAFPLEVIKLPRVLKRRPPLRQFGLHIHPHAVSRLQHRRWRRIRMKPDMIDPEALHQPQVRHPALDLHGGISRVRKDNIIRLAAKKGCSTIDSEHPRFGIGLKLAQPEIGLLGIFERAIVGRKLDRAVVEHWVKLVPKRRLCAERENDLLLGIARRDCMNKLFQRRRFLRVRLGRTVPTFRTNGEPCVDGRIRAVAQAQYKPNRLLRNVWSRTN